MKQNIIIEQLEELSQPARQKLRKYMLKEWARPMKDARTTGPFAGVTYHAEIPTEDYLLSIGQMIEFLDEHNRPMVLTRHSQWHGDSWSINYTKEPPKSLTESAIDDALGLTASKELCDALWQVVKEVLES